MYLYIFSTIILILSECIHLISIVFVYSFSSEPSQHSEINPRVLHFGVKYSIPQHYNLKRRYQGMHALPNGNLHSVHTDNAENLVINKLVIMQILLKFLKYNINSIMLGIMTKSHSISKRSVYRATELPDRCSNAMNDSTYQHT